MTKGLIGNGPTLESTVVSYTYLKSDYVNSYLKPRPSESNLPMTKEYRFNLYQKPISSKQPTQKETNMSSFTFIKRLSDTSLNNELNAAGVSEMLSDELKNALEDQIAQERVENAKAAAREIIQVIRKSDERITAHVLAIRELNRAIAVHKAKIEELNRARAYGSETQNFIPLAALTVDGRDALELSSLVENREQLKVPADFKPKAIVKVQVPKNATKKTAK